MGWKQCDEALTYRWLPPQGGGLLLKEVPAYSTDAACIPEMVAWLYEKQTLSVQLYAGQGLSEQKKPKGVWRATCWHHARETPNSWAADGDTISLALCKLVEAVAKREGSG